MEYLSNSRYFLTLHYQALQRLSWLDSGMRDQSCPKTHIHHYFRLKRFSVDVVRHENKNTLVQLPDGSRVTMSFNPAGIRGEKQG